MNLEVKKVAFRSTEVKEIERDGIKYGVICGYASTFGNVDRVGDVVTQGAFAKTINRHKNDNRAIRAYYQHDAKELIGGFNPLYVREDQTGLYVEGEINLDVQRGREVYALAKQGVLCDMSIGYTIEDFEYDQGIRYLREVDLWEISVVTEPANPLAKITSVKSIDDIKNLIKKKSDYEQILRDAGFSRSSAKYMASLIDLNKLNSEDEMDEQKDLELCEEVSQTEIADLSTIETISNEPALAEVAAEQIEHIEPVAEAVEEIESPVEEDSLGEEDIVNLLTAVRELLRNTQ